MLPITRDNLDIRKAPKAPTICINKMAIIKPVLPLPSGQSISLLAKIVAINITVCTPVLKKKKEYRNFFNLLVVLNSLNTKPNSIKPLHKTPFVGFLPKTLFGNTLNVI